MSFRKPLTLPAVVLLVAAVSGISQSADKDIPKDAELTEANYETWRDHVLPRSWELNFQKIEWRTSFWEAVVEAQEKDKPILLWTMNGHPLCNT